jgi:predicted nucleotidyltransferase
MGYRKQQEVNGMYTIEEIKSKAVPVAQRYGVGKLSLFGSYAKGLATEKSDIDFVIDRGNLHGLRFYSFINTLEDVLKKRVEVLTYDQLPATLFMDDVLKEEIKLYE